jgi:TP901-1 family phage major tail protein
MGISGRSIRVRRGTTSVAGARVDGFSINAEPVDITDKDDAGWRTLLANVGTRSIELTVSGVTTDATLIAVITGTATAILENYTVLITAVGTLSGNFHLGNISITGEQADAITFEATLASSGVITWTAA